jgi:hypothetical protein
MNVRKPTYGVYSGSKDRMEAALMRKLGRAWIRKMRAYGKYCAGAYKDGDYAWAYRERPAIGFLAAAAWSVERGVALEEYAAAKAHSKSARVDLYTGFHPPCESRYRNYLWEAKHGHLSITASDAEQKRIQMKLLDSAGRSASQVKLGGDEVGVGVAFLTLRAARGISEAKALVAARGVCIKAKRCHSDALLIAYLVDSIGVHYATHRAVGILMVAKQCPVPKRGAKK